MIFNNNLFYNMEDYNMIQDQKHWSQTLIYKVSSKSNIPRYQLLLFINFAFKWILAGMILFSLNFFYVTPQFQCGPDDHLIDGQSCSNYVCKLTQSQWVSHLKQPVPKSIALNYEVIMLCSNTWLSSLLQSLSYIGSFVGYLVMSHIADNFGRKNTERISWIINIVGISILIGSINLYMVGIGSFLMGLGTNATITLHYTFLKEMLVGKMRERSFILLQIAFSCGVAFVALASWFIYDWKLVAGLLMLLPSIILIPYSLYIIEETPNFSVKQSKTVLLNSLNRIGKINNEEQLIMQDLQFIPEHALKSLQESKTASQYSLIDLFRYKSLKAITITCAIVDLVIQFIYDGTILSLDKIGINVYLDQILVGFVEIFAALFCSWVVVKVRRNIIMRIFLVLAAGFTFVIGIITLLFEHKDNQLNFHVFFEMILLAGLRFVLNSMWGLFFVYVSQLFPSNVLSLAFGWVSSIGTVGAFTSPFIRLLTANATMFFMSGLCILTFFLIRNLRETKGQKSVQQIQEREVDNMKKKSIQSQKAVQ